MKILYGVQGTGNGHFSRAIAITPFLEKHGSVDILVSGSQHDIRLPFDVTYRSPGAGFHFGNQGGIDIGKTISTQKPMRFWKDVRSLPVHQYDLVISDFEPVTAWACKLRRKSCIALSHQAAFLSDKTPRPSKTSQAAEFVLRNYAPASQWLGFHYQAYDPQIVEPIIRNSIRQMQTSEEGHYTVYLPAYSSNYLLSVFQKIKNIRWKIYVKGRYNVCHNRNITLMPVGHPQWKHDVASASGVIIGAGFEGPSEMMYLGKKMLAIPMSGQYEQQCNAEALRQLGVPTIPKLSMDHLTEIEQWIQHGKAMIQHYPFATDLIVQRVIDMNQRAVDPLPALVSSN